ncbi:putative nuclease HARBI1 [Prorops nasuta]|uniref:putative nuclease HARBI1 n=1 Tax=Prorops nasuta TaxID=863751 RepID=UPI0034CF0D66
MAEEQHIQRRPRRKRVNIRNNGLLYFNDEEFRIRFRLNKVQFKEVLLQIEAKIIQRDRNNAVPPVIQLLAAMRYYATGSFLIMIADSSGISKKMAQIIIHRVSSEIANLFQRYIRLPRTEFGMLKTVKKNFLVSGMIRIYLFNLFLGGEDAEIWRNRKGFFSINVQCLVNSDLQIMDIVARWPGSTHDSTIFDHSRLKQRFDDMELNNGIILADRGYRNHRYLLTPLANPTTPAEILYNEAHIRTRCMVERCFGVWGRLFPVLTIGSRFRKPQSTINVIIATAVLYNIIRRDSKPADKGNMQNYLNIDQIYADPTENDRQYLIDNYFSRYMISDRRYPCTKAKIKQR